jgi:hypothetical protein
MGEPTSRTCKGCNIEFETTRKQQTFCDNECRKRYWKETQALPSVARKFGLDKNVVGAIAECRVCVDLLQRGFHVFRAVSFHSPVDIVAFRGDDGPAFRIEVRTAYRRGERLYHPPPRPGRYDVLAAVTADEIVYSLTLPEK